MKFYTPNVEREEGYGSNNLEKFLLGLEDAPEQNAHP